MVVRPAARRLLDHQEIIVRALLNLDEVRHHGHLGNVPELLPEPRAAVERLSHIRSLILAAGDDSRVLHASAAGAATPRVLLKRLAGGSARGATPCRNLRGTVPNWSLPPNVRGEGAQHHLIS